MNRYYVYGAMIIFVIAVIALVSYGVYEAVKSTQKDCTDCEKSNSSECKACKKSKDCKNCKDESSCKDCKNAETCIKCYNSAQNCGGGVIPIVCRDLPNDVKTLFNVGEIVGITLAALGGLIVAIIVFASLFSFFGGPGMLRDYLRKTKGINKQTSDMSNEIDKTVEFLKKNSRVSEKGKQLTEQEVKKTLDSLKDVRTKISQLNERMKIANSQSAVLDANARSKARDFYSKYVEMSKKLINQFNDFKSEYPDGFDPQNEDDVSKIQNDIGDLNDSVESFNDGVSSISGGF